MLLIVFNGILACSIAYCMFLYVSFRQIKRVFELLLFIGLYLFVCINLNEDLELLSAILFSAVVIYKIFSFSELIVKTHKEQKK